MDLLYRIHPPLLFTGNDTNREIKTSIKAKRNKTTIWIENYSEVTQDRRKMEESFLFSVSKNIFGLPIPFPTFFGI